MQYEKNPKYWWQHEKLHKKYKIANKELKNKYKRIFEKKYKKNDKEKDEE